MPTVLSAPDTASQQALIRTGAVALSMLLHGLFFIGAGGSISATMPEMPSTSVTRLSFQAPAPLPDVLPDQPQELVKEEKKRVEKVVERAKALKKVAKATPEEIKPVAESHPMQQQAAAAPDSAPQLHEGAIQREKDRYLSDVMAHIEQHKWYPKAARRRGLEGEITVRFILLPDGSAENVLVENGPELLMAAARKAVEKATPMPTPPAKIHCPLKCEFRMRFSLNET